ncbi:MAG: ArsR/SmtB family transcription factor [Nocardioidaceae bacterium]
MANDRRISYLRAIAHPVRLRILSLLTGAEMSAAEIARELDLTHANASYHLRVLADAGEIVVAGEEKIRGGVAKRYRHPWDREEVTPSGGPASGGDRSPSMRAVADELVRRFASRRSPSKGLLVDAEMWVTPEVWGEVLEHLDAASRAIHANAQPPRTPGTTHVNLTAGAFEMKATRQ